MERPDHDDFWLMAEIVQDLDAAADDGVALERIISAVDADSLTYVSSQRVLRLVGLPSRGNPTWASVGSAWFEGFIVGMNFQKRRQERSEKTPD